MDPSLVEYPALLGSLQPQHAASVLNDRLKLMNKVNTDIADWLQERRRVEELYVSGLRKLAKRLQPDHGASFGIFQVPWKRILSSTESMASSHETLAQKIEADVERPLRDYSTKNSEMQSMPTIQTDFSNLAKSLETAQKKADKMKDRGSKSEKASNAISAANEAKDQWESRAPFVFEKLQAVDESRVNHLRDLLTQLEAHELDLIERNRKTVENCMSALLGVETKDEIKRFVTKIGGNEVGPAARPAATATSPERRTHSTSGSDAPLPQPPKINHDDAISQYSGRSTHAQPTPASEPRQTPFGGLRRLGTVMGRRKSAMQAPGSGFIQEKKQRGPFGLKRGGSSQEGRLPVSPSPPQTAQTESLSVNSHDESSIRPTSARQGTNDDAMEPISEGQQTPKAEAQTGVTGTTLQEEPQNTAGNETDAEGFSRRPDTIDEITLLQRESSATEEPSPNLTIRDQPIHEDENAAQQAMSDVASRLRQQAQQSGSIRRNAGTLRGRRDVRNTVFVPSTASPEQELSTYSPGSTIAPLPTPLAPRNVTSPMSSEDRTISETNSVHSSNTLHSLAPPVVHPDLHEPGLNASIVETVSSWFSDGAATKSFVVGELALAYNPTSDPAPETERVRLDNFQILEKVAANPHFVTEASPAHSSQGKERETSDYEKTGEYNVALPIITRPSPTVAFKYQIHLDKSDLSSYSPVLFTPVWNLEEFQASVIVSYALNPLFTSLKSFTLKNLALTVNLDLSPDETSEHPREVARATQAVMYPNVGATFRRKQSAALWRIPELEVKSGQDGKFLARFTTAASWPRKGKVEAKFEVSTSNNEGRLGLSACAAPTAEQKEIDPFADEIAGTVGAEPKPNLTAWKDVSISRKLVAGKYVSS